MSANRRPVSVLVIACIYIAVGSIGFVFHFHDWRHSETTVIELTEILAVVAGVFLLRAQNWARWLAIAWMAFHVALSAFGAVRELVMHSLIFIAITWLLFLPDARRYFRGEDEAA